MMTSLYARNNTDLAPRIDLVRDLALLTHTLEADERAQFIEQIQPLLDSYDAGNPDSLKFDTAEDLAVALKETKHDCYLITTCEPSHVEEVLLQAQRLQEHIKEIRQVGSGLFYDFYAIGELNAELQVTPEMKRGADVYINFGTNENFHGFYEALLVATEAGLDQGELDTVLAGDTGVWDSASDTSDTGLPSLAQLSQNGVSTTVDTAAFFDFSEIPYEIFEGHNSLTIRPDDVIQIMMLTDAFNAEDRKKIIHHVFEWAHRMTEEHAVIQDEYANMLNAFELVSVLSSQYSLPVRDCAQVLSNVDQMYAGNAQEMNDSRYAYLQEKHGEVVKALHLDAVLNQMTTGLANYKEFGYDTYGLNDKQMARVFTLLHYMDAESVYDVLSTIAKFEPQGTTEGKINTIQMLSGLRHEDFIDIYERSFATVPDTTVPAMYGGMTLSKAKKYYNEYFVSRKSTMNEHRELARRFYEGHDYVNGEMVNLVALAESEGGLNKVNKAGLPYYGIMQIGYDAYTTLGGELKPKPFKESALNNDAFNMRVGTKYLKWCFDYGNPAKSIAIALSNYNHGIGYTLDYRMSHIYGSEIDHDLPPETKGYIIKYLMYSRLLPSKT
jgi:hypothetical protein